MTIDIKQLNDDTLIQKLSEYQKDVENLIKLNINEAILLELYKSLTIEYK